MVYSSMDFRQRRYSGLDAMPPAKSMFNPYADMTVPRRQTFRNQPDNTEARVKSRSSSKVINANLPILATTAHPTVTQPDTRHWSSVPSERPFAFPRPRIPHFDHPVLGTGHKPECIRRDGPHAFNMPKEFPYTPSRVHVPKPNRRVKC